MLLFYSYLLIKYKFTYKSYYNVMSHNLKRNHIILRCLKEHVAFFFIKPA